MQPCNMAEIEKEEVEFPACATLWQGGFHKVTALYFLLFTYMVQLYQEEWIILHVLGCQAVALPSTEQIVIFLQAYTVPEKKNEMYFNTYLLHLVLFS